MINKLKNQTIFVTGGAGFVGSHLVDQLLPLKPKKIIILDSFFRGSRRNMKNFITDKTVEFIKDDIRNLELMDSIMSQTDYLFHMAALRINACAADNQMGYEVMVKATFDLINSAVKYKLKKAIYSSSASIYGLAQHFPTPESDHPYDNQTLYGVAKLFGEQLLRSYHHMHQLNYVALRYFNVYGERMDTDGKYTEVIIKWLDCIRDNQSPKIFGDGSDTMDFVHVSDVAKANVLAAQADTSDKVYNIGSQQETSLKQLLELLLKVNKSKLKPVYVAANQVNPVSRRLADISLAKKELQYQPSVSLKKGLEQLSEWYFQVKKS